MAALGLGLLSGLVFALPVKTGPDAVSCPAPGEGRAYCVLQQAYAPAGVKIAVALLAAWLLHDLLFRWVPAMRRRWAAGERLVLREDGMGHDVVVADPLLAAANRGVMPDRRRTWRVAKARPSAPAAAAIARAAGAAGAAEPRPERMPWTDPDPRLVVPAAAEDSPPAPEPARAPLVRALDAGQRSARSTGRHGRQMRVLGADEARGRHLRRGNDPALVVSCWSDATSARDLPDEVRAGVSA